MNRYGAEYVSTIADAMTMASGATTMKMIRLFAFAEFSIETRTMHTMRWFSER